MARVGCGTGAGNSGGNSTSNWIRPDTNRAPPAYSGGMGTTGGTTAQVLNPCQRSQDSLLHLVFSLSEVV